MTELTIIHLNARSVGNKIKDIHALTIEKKTRHYQPKRNLAKKQ